MAPPQRRCCCLAARLASSPPLRRRRSGGSAAAARPPTVCSTIQTLPIQSNPQAVLVCSAGSTSVYFGSVRYGVWNWCVVCSFFCGCARDCEASMCMARMCPRNSKASICMACMLGAASVQERAASNAYDPLSFMRSVTLLVGVGVLGCAADPGRKTCGMGSARVGTRRRRRGRGAGRCREPPHDAAATMAAHTV